MKTGIANVHLNKRPERSPLCDGGCGATAQRLGELGTEIPGFLDEDSARTRSGSSIAVAYFRPLAGIEQWPCEAT